MKKSNKRQHQLRIITGQWRGRKLTVCDAIGLRPTSDRIRETVFNWLTPKIIGAKCVDLFAGTGALGIEAASRGAAAVDLVEVNKSAVMQLNAHLATLDAKQCHCHHTTAQQWIVQCRQQYDIVFIDPPFQAALWAEVVSGLHQYQLLAQGAWIYIEQPNTAAITLPDKWQQYKQKKAGAVSYGLYQYHGE